MVWWQIRNVPAVWRPVSMALFTAPTCPLMMMMYLPGQMAVAVNSSTLAAFSISSAVCTPAGMLFSSINPIDFPISVLFSYD